MLDEAETERLNLKILSVDDNLEDDLCKISLNKIY